MVLAPILRAASPKRVLELVLTGRELPAAEALEIGLVTRVVPRAELDDDRRPRRRGRWPGSRRRRWPSARRPSIGRSSSRTPQALAHLRDLLTIVARSDDAQEGIAAFLEKRPPRWQGR